MPKFHSHVRGIQICTIYYEMIGCSIVDAKVFEFDFEMQIPTLSFGQPLSQGHHLLVLYQA